MGTDSLPILADYNEVLLISNEVADMTEELGHRA